jgi:hypothetical protein
MDIVAAYRGAEGARDAGSIAIFYQDPGRPGTFAAPVSYGLACEATDLDAGDLNSDGLPDIAVAVRCAGAGAIQLFFQDHGASRSYAPAARLPCEEVPFSLKIGDLDQDGRNDMAVSDGDVVGFYQRGAIPGDFPDRAVILKSELSYGGGSGGGGAGGGGCFIGAVAR